jgi:hypothetical protein
MRVKHALDKLPFPLARFAIALDILVEQVSESLRPLGGFAVFLPLAILGVGQVYPPRCGRPYFLGARPSFGERDRRIGAVGCPLALIALRPIANRPRPAAV